NPPLVRERGDEVEASSPNLLDASATHFDFQAAALVDDLAAHPAAVNTDPKADLAAAVDQRAGRQLRDDQEQIVELLRAQLIAEALAHDLARNLRPTPGTGHVERQFNRQSGPPSGTSRTRAFSSRSHTQPDA